MSTKAKLRTRAYSLTGSYFYKEMYGDSATDEGLVSYESPFIIRKVNSKV